MSVPFSGIEDDFTGATSFGGATTVDLRGRPRGRMLHPVWHPQA